MRLKIPLFICLSILASCDEGHVSENAQIAFGIYLTQAEVLPSRLKNLSYIEPSAMPLLSLDDIRSYSWSSHVIHLAEKGKKVLDTLTVPVHGRSFCVCVNNSPKYYGAFWIPISSLSFVGTTIILMKPTADSIRIGRGYPTDSDTTRPEPRMNSDVATALRNAGKLL
jgi:hypothetical protein